MRVNPLPLSLFFCSHMWVGHKGSVSCENIIPFVMKEPNELLRVTEQEYFEKRKIKGWPKHKKGLSEQMHMVHVHSLSKQWMPPLSPLSPPTIEFCRIFASTLSCQLPLSFILFLLFAICTSSLIFQ